MSTSELYAPEFQCYSPPEYQAKKIAERNLVLLEERLLHFIEWMEEQGVILWAVGRPLEDGYSPNPAKLVTEYVNS